MRASVHSVLLTATISLLLTFPTAFLRAQMTTVRLSVSKVQKFENNGYKDSNDGWWGETVKTKTKPTTAYCDIKIQYMGTTPMKNVRVAWKLLVQLPKHARASVKAGEKTVDLQLGKDVEFETDPEDGKAIGYLVEVSTNDLVLASTSEPSDFEARLKKAKPAR